MTGDAAADGPRAPDLGGRPPHVPTAEGRKQVNAMAAYGTPQIDICLVLDISLPTLHKYYRHELDTAMIKANAAIGQSLFHMATKGNNVAAAIFWAKTRMGWTEVNRTELTGRNGGPIDLRAIAANASDDDLAAIAFGSGTAALAPPEDKD